MRFMLLFCGAALAAPAVLAGDPPTTPNPILFVTQVPVPVDFRAIGSTFANHLATPASVYRGGDLWIRYPAGTLRNLTFEAGFGNAGLQAANAIAVRDPHVHWSGTKAVFSMVIGAPGEFEQNQYRWQLYEVTGLGIGQTVSIAPVPNQPTLYNNVMPAYLSDGDIVFASDRPRNGAAHLYPQQDEYESDPTPTGLWRLDPATAELRLLDHSPSGDFDPFVDSFGRLVFTRWDHLQRDQQADVPANGNFDWETEAANSPIAPGLVEVFPELRINPLPDLAPHSFNNFFPWEVFQDGSGAEFLNHLGRHEFLEFFSLNRTDDPNITDFTAEISGRTNPNAIENLFQITEDPTQPGRFYGIDAPEFDSHASGQLVRLNAPPSANADDIVIDYVTPKSTGTTTPAPDHSGHYRNPTVLADGRVVVAHTFQQNGVQNTGSPTAPQSNYAFRLRLMSGGALPQTATDALTPGITKAVTWYSPDVLLSYNGELWELSPVEVRARTAPPELVEPPLAQPEVNAFTAAGVDAAAFRQFMRDRNLGLLVVRRAVDRDKADKQQPYNLSIPGGVSAVSGVGGTVYQIQYMQVVQGDQVRGIGGAATPSPGRRVLARHLHEPAAIANNLPNPGGPVGSSLLFPDGSTAIFVPARRALSWQLTAPNANPVVRERFWLTVQPGEIRMCEGCHGINRAGQAGQPDATNTPQALTALLNYWKSVNGTLFANGFE